MRIIISALTVPTTLEWEYGLALEEHNHTLIKHYRTEDREKTIPDWLFRLGRRILPKAVYKKSNDDLLKLVCDYNPDFIWLFKGADIFPDTVRKIRKMGYTVIVYNADHPFRFFSRGSGNAFIEQSIPEYNLYLTYSRTIAAELAVHYPKLRTCVIPFGHSVDEETYSVISQEQEVIRPCFLGNPDSYRAEYIKHLLNKGINVDVYGHGWNNFLPRSEGLQIFGAVLGLDMYKTLRRYRVQLNFLRPHNANSHNMRTFEAPACGAIMLAEETEEHIEFFRTDIEAFYFTDKKTLTEKVRYLLSMSAVDANDIRNRARNRSVNMAYTYRDRASQVINIVENLDGKMKIN
jgi:hypothetical protein